ncbi:VOC family protein [Streptomyces sp. NPDC048644]|uniref:VOC family protein n=1 Tax=Streptomyces sp. NPDC048644 TaxID=3365582 RepID=UPI00371171C2
MPTAEYVAPVPGAPCWVSLSTHDLGSAQDFYGPVLGWTFRPGSLGDDFSVALAEGQPVAGLGAVAPKWHLPVVWTPYFAVEGADDTAARIRERGATVAVGPLRLGHGRVALAADRDGANFGFWEGRTPAWSVGHGSAPPLLELRTRDAFDAAIFYAEVFGWASGHPGGCDVVYADEEVVVSEGGRTVATLRGGGVESAPDPHVRPQWHIHFHVADVERTAAAAAAAGGFVLPLPPTVGTSGPQAVIRDPDGGLFTVSTP